MKPKVSYRVHWSRHWFVSWSTARISILFLEHPFQCDSPICAYFSLVDLLPSKFRTKQLYEYSLFSRECYMSCQFHPASFAYSNNTGLSMMKFLILKCYPSSYNFVLIASLVITAWHALRFRIEYTTPRSRGQPTRGGPPALRLCMGLTAP
jgi:hypothetical protein